MPSNDLSEELEARVTLAIIREISDCSFASNEIMSVWPEDSKVAIKTYGQDKAETRAMPMTSAYLIRKAIRKEVTMPPQKTPTQS
jgi:hypothetical protein